MFKPFKEQHNHNTRGATRYVLNIRKIKTSFYGSRSVQVESVKDWNNIIDKAHFTTEDFMNCSQVIRKIPFFDKTILVTILDNLDYYLSAFV